MGKELHFDLELVVDSDVPVEEALAVVQSVLADLESLDEYEYVSVETEPPRDETLDRVFNVLDNLDDESVDSAIEAVEELEDE